MSFALLLLLCVSQLTEALKLVSLGDWGTAQTLTQAHLNDYIRDDKPDAVLLLGDNFYVKGVTSVHDPQFNSKFQVPFKDVPCGFYVCAGNHDWYGNATAEVAYTSADHSKRWRFPALYHEQMFKGADGVKVRVVFVDTWMLNGGDTILAYANGRFSLSESGLQAAVAAGDVTPDVADALRAEHGAKPAVEAEADWAQYAWLDKVLAQGGADWTLVCGHFPVRSASRQEHGDTANLVHDLDPLLRAHGVHAYLSGHDHILQHIQHQGTLSYFGSGAGAKTHDKIVDAYDGLRSSVTGAYGYVRL